MSRETLQPFVDASRGAIEQMGIMATPEGQAAALAGDPTFQGIQDFTRTAQRPELERMDFDPIRDNPFLEQAQHEVGRRLDQQFANRGRSQSGDSALEISRQLALTGNALANDEFSRRMNQGSFNNQGLLADFDIQTQQDSQRFNDLLNTAAARSGIVMDQFNQQNALLNAGLGAANGQVNAGTQMSSQMANITQGIGNALAAGEIGASRARRGFFGGLLNLGVNAATGGMSGMFGGGGGNAMGGVPMQLSGSGGLTSIV